MKYYRMFLALLVGAGLLAACQNPQLPSGPSAEDPLPEEPGTEEPVPDEPLPEDPEPEPEPEPDPDPDPPALTETTIMIDFQSETSGIVAEGFAASGTARTPEPGQLDADAWSITGFSDGDVAFGQEVATGDIARGTSTGGETVGGLYAFSVADDDVALGVQPTSSDFAPGSLILSLPAPSDAVSSISLSFRFWTYNDQGRATAWSVAYSTDGAEWIALPELAHTTPPAEDEAPQWQSADYEVSVALESVDLATGAPVYIRWSAEDGEGAGSRDESALDNIQVTFTHPE